MINLKKINTFKIFFFINLFFISSVQADNLKISETLENIQNDIKTLEKAVYSGSIVSSNSSFNSDSFNNNSEDVLTRHLLKLSEIENQFQELTNKFEEINFKLDKLSSRLSKVQADNQIRFQDIENNLTINGDSKLSLKKQMMIKKKIYQDRLNLKI